MATIDQRCLDKNHPLREILRTSCGYDLFIVVRWCPQCGAVVTDGDTDGRTDPGRYMKLTLPETTKALWREQKG